MRRGHRYFQTDLAVLDHHDAVGQCAGLGHVVGYQHQREAMLPPELRDQLLPRTRWRQQWSRPGTGSARTCSSLWMCHARHGGSNGAQADSAAQRDVCMLFATTTGVK